MGSEMCIRDSPSTEQVLSSASFVLNGGGFEQLATITTELNRALGGETHPVGELIPRLDSFVGALDAQRVDIRSAIRAVDALSARFAASRTDITKALDQLGPALEVLARERPRLTEALVSLRELGEVAVPLVDQVKADLIKDMQDITPALQALQDSGDSLTRALGFAVTFPFAPETVTNACRGDYCNLDLTLDLTNSSIINGFTTAGGTPAIPGLPGIPDLPDILGGLGDSLEDALGGVVSGLQAQVVQPLAGELLGKAESDTTTKGAAR